MSLKWQKTPLKLNKRYTQGYKMKKAVILPLMLFTFSVSTTAKEAPIDELFRVMSIDKQMTGGFEAMMPMIEQMAGKLKLDSVGKEELKGIFRAWFDEDIDRSKIISEIKKHYTKIFTDDEIIAITKFYQTPAGKKFLKESPQLMKLGAQIGMQEGQSKQVELMERIKPFLKKHGIKQ